MPLSYKTDSEHRLVIAKGHGVLTYNDILDYSEDVASHPELIGFDEIVDVVDVDRIAYESSRQVRELAEHAAYIESGRTTLLAIVAPDLGAYGLARMYQTYRGLQPESKKKVAVFHSFEEASQWIVSERRLVSR